MSATFTTGVNTNPANGSQYQIVFNRMPNVIFNCVNVVIPGPSVSAGEQNTPFKAIPVPGGKIQHAPFEMSFIVNEDYSNWEDIFTWIKDQGSPEYFGQYSELEQSEEGLTSDIRVLLFNSAVKQVAEIQFDGAFPITLSNLDLETRIQDPEPLVATAQFEFVSYRFKRI